MKKVGKVFKYLVIILLSLMLLIFILRYINEKTTRELSEIKNSSIDATKYMDGFNRENYEKSNLKNTEISVIDNGIVQGYHFMPKDENHKGTIITFSGSDGGIDTLHSVLLSENGYDVYAMNFFGAKNQNKELVEVDLEIFKAILEYIKSENKTVQKVSILGSSKGAELSLLLANYYSDDIDKVILYAPSSYVWQGLATDRNIIKSSWEFEGKPLKFLSFKDTSLSALIKFGINALINKPYEFKIFYDSVLDENLMAYECTIPMNNINSKILIFAGEEDKMWDSAKMGGFIKAELPEKVEFYNYKDAGHIFYGPSVFNNMRTGGDYEANVEALIDSNKKLLDFMNEDK